MTVALPPRARTPGAAFRAPLVSIAANPKAAAFGIVVLPQFLPTSGPVLLNALLVQDMYLAAGFIMLLSLATIIGMLLSDIALVWLDPRIRYES